MTLFTDRARAPERIHVLVGAVVPDDEHDGRDHEADEPENGDRPLPEVVAVGLFHRVVADLHSGEELDLSEG